MVSSAALSGEHKLVYAGNRSGEHTRGDVEGGALVQHHTVEDDWFVLELSQHTLMADKEKNRSTLCVCCLTADSLHRIRSNQDNYTQHGHRQES